MTYYDPATKSPLALAVAIENPGPLPGSWRRPTVREVEGSVPLPRLAGGSVRQEIEGSKPPPRLTSGSNRRNVSDDWIVAGLEDVSRRCDAVAGHLDTRLEVVNSQLEENEKRFKEETDELANSLEIQGLNLGQLNTYVTSKTKDLEVALKAGTNNLQDFQESVIGRFEMESRAVQEELAKQWTDFQKELAKQWSDFHDELAKQSSEFHEELAKQSIEFAHERSAFNAELDKQRNDFQKELADVREAHWEVVVTLQKENEKLKVVVNGMAKELHRITEDLMKKDSEAKKNGKEAKKNGEESKKNGKKDPKNHVEMHFTFNN